MASTGLGVLPLCLIDFMRRIPKWRKTLCGSAAVVLPTTCGYGLSIGYGICSSLLLAASIWLAVQLIGLCLSCGWKFYKERQVLGLALVAWILCGLAFQSRLLFSSVR